MNGLHIIAQGNVRIKDGRKWKYRWAVIVKLSPVAGKFIYIILIIRFS